MIAESNIQKLVDVFADATHKHHEALMEGNSRKANKQAKRVADTFQAIITTGDMARQALLQLTKSEDMAVASTAATFSLKYATDESIAVLKRVAQRTDLLGFRAEQALKRWEEGSWHLE